MSPCICLLDVYGHELHCAGDEGQLLLEEVSRTGNAVPHEDLVRAAAHAGKVDTLCPDFFGEPLYLRVTARGNEKLRKERLVAVNHHVHFIFFQYPLD